MKNFVKAEDFVKIWQSAESIEEAAEKLGYTKRAASMQASYYRKCGVLLKRFRNRETVDWEKLKKLVEKGGKG